MKKVTLSVAALAIAISSYSQSNVITSSYDSVLVSREAIEAEKAHKNLRDIVYKAEDMLYMIEQDVDSGFMYEQYAKFYQKLLGDVIKLAANTEINGQDLDCQGKYYDNLNCENCDEID